MPEEPMAFLTINDVPDWLKMRYIFKGYPKPGKTISECLMLCFQVHNQTINVWTMIVWAILAVALFAYIVGKHSSKMRLWDYSVFFIYMVSILIHLPFSVGYHVMRFVDNDTMTRWKKMDLLFISVNGLLVLFALLAYVFPLWVTIALTTMAVVLLYRIYWALFKKDKIDITQKKEIFRNILGVNMLCAIPAIYATIKHWNGNRIISWMAIGGILSLLFASSVYATSFPEKHFPHKFDILGTSHQLMHVGAILSYVFGFFFIYLQSGLQV